MQTLEFMITITDRTLYERFISLYMEHGMPVVLSALGRGTATVEMLDLFGLEANEKAVMFNVVSREKKPLVLRDIRKKLNIDIPGTGIVITIPVSSIGKTTLTYLTAGQQAEREEVDMEKDYAFELIVAIINEGCSEMVMDAARAANATGGTVIHARGASMERAKKFFGVSLADEKEILFIVTKAADKTNIMKAIMTDAGVKTEAGTMLLSVPVSSVAGLRKLEEDAEA